MLYQYFGGERVFSSGALCEANELMHFRNRMGDEGIKLIFKESIHIKGKHSQKQEATPDTTVQGKNITCPTDNKLLHKIIKKCVFIEEKENIELRQSYTRTLKKLLRD